jgi:glucokinase
MMGAEEGAMDSWVLGVDLGGTNTAFGYVDAAGRCLGSGTMATDSHRPPAEFFRRLHRHASELLDRLEPGHPLAGVGVASASANYYTGAIERPVNLKWDRVDIVAGVRDHYPLPVAVTNDANAVALGELLFGAGRGMRDFIAITLGTGLGSGVVVNGELVYGADGLAGELGHLPVTIRSGRECGCGQRGCLETYASATGIVRTALELMAERRAPSPLRSMPCDRITSLVLYELALKGDPLALEAFDRTGRILGAKLADLVLFSRPEAFILFGGLAAAGELLFRPVREALDASLPDIFAGKIPLLPSGVAGDDAAILGAGALVWTELRKQGNPPGRPAPGGNA